jgi:hypothetical protein
MEAVTAEERSLCTRIAGGAEPLTTGLADAARHHRLHLLLAARLSQQERRSLDGVSLVRELTVAAALNAWHEEVLRELLDSLAAGGVPVLLLKGTGLAYTVYPEPHLRPRLDVDALIRRNALDRAEQVLAARGWVRPPERDSELAEPQRHYVKSGPAKVLYHLDLHWKIANPRLFADALTFDELESRAIAIATLGPSARTLGHINALLVACLHRVAHHADAIDFLWLWDIHLLLERLSTDDRERFIALAERTGMRAICARGLQLANDLFGTAGAAEMAARLAKTHDGSTKEPSSRFLGGARAITVLRTDLTTLPWRDRLQLIRDHLFPSTVYMRARYPRWPPALLPFAYVDRIARGAPKWFKRA